MRQQAAAIVAAAAVVATVGGGVIAARQGPRSSPADVAPLAAASPSASGTPQSADLDQTGPVKVAVELDALGTGRSPQLVYASGREVRGGPGGPRTVPGTGRINDVALGGSALFAIEDRDGALTLLRTGWDRTTEIPGVTTLVASADNRFATYATQRSTTQGRQLRGAAVYADDGVTPRKLSLPRDWNVKVLAYAAGQVFYSASSGEDGDARLYSWVPGRSAARAVANVAIPTAVSADGRLVASIDSGNDSGSCSSVIEVATGRRLWRTCDQTVVGFSPDKSLAIGTPASWLGYAPSSVWLLDGRTGDVRREWTGQSFKRARAEDDQHLLMEVDHGPDSPGTILRCDVRTGTCERATPARTGTRLGSGT